MKHLNLVNAVASALMLVLLAAFFMGMRLDLDGTHLVVNNAGRVRWNWIALGAAVVFLFQLLRPLLQKSLKKSPARRWFCRELTAPRRSKSWCCW